VTGWVRIRSHPDAAPALVHVGMLPRGVALLCGVALVCRPLLLHCLGHPGQSLEGTVDQRGRTEHPELRHPVADVSHPHGPLLPRVFMPLIERPRLEPLGHPSSHPPHPSRGFGLGEDDHLGRIGVATRGIVEVLARFADDTRVRSTETPGALRLPHQREALDDPRRIRHPALHRAIAHPQRGAELRGNGARRHLSVVGVLPLLGDLEREP
jgi:hypothetical protein